MPSPLHRSHLQTDAVGLTALGLLSLSSIVFGLVFLLRKKPPGAKEAKRAPASLWGIFLASISFVSIWVIWRTPWWPFPPSFTPGDGGEGIENELLVNRWLAGWAKARPLQLHGKKATGHVR